MKTTKIAVVDDRDDARKMVADVIEDAIINLDIKNNWSVIETTPFLNLGDYSKWINNEQIGVLILDERLGEVPGTSGKSVNYKGSDLVNILRTQFKGMPIYGVTSYPDDPSMQQHFALFDEVMKREDFSSKASLYVERFLRTYKNFLESNEKELTELSMISKRIAIGKATTKQKKRAEAIQKNLEIPVTTIALNSRKEWLDAYQEVIDSFKMAQKEAKRYLNQKNKK
ncbi:MAG: hypothetical protein WC827_01560 [Candidatus Paceibacterota bacterium]|jgi:hypothetical protein